MFVGSALIYSGRDNPRWQVDASIVEELERIWEALLSTTDLHPAAPPLGYRGCFLKVNDKYEWFAYQGVVTMRKDSGLESRLDTGRKFEKLLLASAPEEMLPPSIMGDE